MHAQELETHVTKMLDDEDLIKQQEELLASFTKAPIQTEQDNAINWVMPKQADENIATDDESKPKKRNAK